MAVDLSTRYLGIGLKNPLVVGACPLTGDLATLERLQLAGAAAVVLPSLFEEQIEHEEMATHSLYEMGTESFGEALSYFPRLDAYNTGPESYLEHLRAAVKRLDIPVIASLNGHTSGGWVRYAQLIEEKGAHGLELNIYFLSTDPESEAAAIEDRYLRLVEDVRSRIGIPLAVKIGPYFSSLPNLARKLVQAGADGLVLFNRFLQPDIDLDTLEVVPALQLSAPQELRLPLRWIAILRGQTPASLAATTGVQRWEDVVKLLLVGADAVQTASALLLGGPEQVNSLVGGLTSWLEEREYTSVSQMKGSLSQVHSPDPAAFERANYMKALTTYSSDLA